MSSLPDSSCLTQERSIHQYWFPSNHKHHTMSLLWSAGTHYFHHGVPRTRLTAAGLGLLWIPVFLAQPLPKLGWLNANFLLCFCSSYILFWSQASDGPFHACCCYLSSSSSLLQRRISFSEELWITDNRINYINIYSLIPDLLFPLLLTYYIFRL